MIEPEKMFARFSTCFSCLILLIHFLQVSQARRHSRHCRPSVCGNIRNISYPFRLRDDPQRCGVSSYELVCENDTTLMHTRSHKYLVQSIDYDNYTIRLADSSVKNDPCSFPQYSQNELEFVSGYPYSVRRFDDGDAILARPVTFLICQYPVNYSFYEKANHCVGRENSRYTYVMVGQLNASQVWDTCTIDLVVMVSLPFRGGNEFSLSEMHSSLLYGFEVSWFSVFCDDKCKGMYYCQWDGSKPACINRNWDGCIYRQQPGCGGILDPIIKVMLWVLQAGLRTIVFINIAKYVLGIPILLGLLICKLRRRHMSMFDAIEHFLLHHNNLVPIRYSYSDIKKMTRGFREKLGQGGYGSVYKGKLRSGHYVAVKVLSAKSKSNGQDFMNEVATIGRIHHVNVVKLVGYCAERSKRALIYDFMPNGSLDKYIFRQETTVSLNWEKKYEIAVGVARGIEYLHRGCDIQILHFDIKPHNILLDDNFTPKISDFGLAKFFSTEKDTVTLTAARGTIGYVAPELINRSIGGVSYKADVYSFGMLLMEMVGLKRDLVQNGENSSQYFPYWIYNHLDKCKDFEAGNINEIDSADEKITRKMGIVALWCIQMSPGDRPSMSRVLEMLEEGDVESLQVPPQPSYSSEVVAQTQTWETDTTTDSISLAM